MHGLNPPQRAAVQHVDGPMLVLAGAGSGKKATMNMRVDAQGRAVQAGPQVEIGGNERYLSVARAEYKKAMRGEGTIQPLQPPLPL